MPAHQRTDSIKQKLVVNSSPIIAAGDVSSATATPTYQYCSPTILSAQNTLPISPKMVSAPYRHVASNVPTPKSSPLRRPNISSNSNQNSPKRKINGEEQWVDGPRLSKSKVAEARHLLREINHVKQREQWIDGPKMSSPSKSLVAGALPAANSNTPGYGYMDSHKKTMIRQWVENQSSQIFTPGTGVVAAQQNQQQTRQILQLNQFKAPGAEDDAHSVESHNEMIHPSSMTFNQQIAAQSSESSIRVGLKMESQQDQRSERSSHASSVQKQNDSQEEEDQDSGPSEVPPALPLIEPLSSREISHDSLHIMCSRHVSRESLGSHHIQTKDCGLQVTEDDIVKAMGYVFFNFVLKPVKIFKTNFQ